MAEPLVSFGGLATGLDTKAIISALVGVRKKPIVLLQDRQTEFNRLKARYGQLKTKLQTLQTKADDLKKSSDFLSFTASTSDTTVVGVSADGSATATSLQVTVSALAAAESEASAGFADYDTTAVGAGTLKITLAGTEHDVTIGAGDDTLEGIRDAINDADLGVTATVVNEGVGANPYRLVVTSDKTGAANTISFSDDLGGSGIAAALNFSNLQAASDSQVTINGFTAYRDSNVVDDVIPGVTFTLLKSGQSTVTLSPDASAIKKKINDYVSAHSDLMSFINAEIAVSDTTDNAGVFNGEATVRNIKNQILSQYGLATFPGGSFSTLAQVGISVERDGSLSFDQSEFDEAIEENLEDVTSLFTTKGDVIAGSGFSLYQVPDAMKPGEYAVAVTQAATKASTQGLQSFPDAGLAGDEKLTITLGAKDVVVQLAAGDKLEDAVSKINKALHDADVDVTARDSSGTLEFAATGYGSKYGFSVISDTAVGPGSTGIGTTTLTATGLDVQGTIGGQAATGDGQYLTGDIDTDFTGVKIRYTGTAPGTADLTVGPDGFFVKMEELLDKFLLPISGSIDARIDALDDTIHSIDDRIDSLDQRAELYRELLTKQFTALEGLIGKMQAEQNYLSTFAFPTFTYGNS